MKRILTIVPVCVLLCALQASALPIDYISATTVTTTFLPAGGANGIGELSLDGTLALIVHSENGQQTSLLNSSFHLDTSLVQDLSDGGILNGEFAGGTLLLKDAGEIELLRGTIDNLSMTEPFNDIGILSAVGSFTVESGSLMSEWAQPYGAIYEIVFEVDPRILADLSTGFSGRSIISLAPVPEPVAIVLLAFGIGGLALRRRR